MELNLGLVICLRGAEFSLGCFCVLFQGMQQMRLSFRGGRCNRPGRSSPPQKVNCDMKWFLICFKSFVIENMFFWRVLNAFHLQNAGELPVKFDYFQSKYCIKFWEEEVMVCVVGRRRQRWWCCYFQGNHADQKSCVYWFRGRFSVFSCLFMIS